MSACPTYKQGMKAINFSFEDEGASEVDHEDFMRGVIANARRKETAGAGNEEDASGNGREM